VAIKPLLQPLSDRELSGQAVLEEPEVVVLAAGKEDKMAATVVVQEMVKVAVEVVKTEARVVDREAVDPEAVDPAVGKAAKTVVRIVVEVEAVKTMIKVVVVETVDLEAVVEMAEVTGMAVEEGPRLWFSLLAL